VARSLSFMARIAVRPEHLFPALLLVGVALSVPGTRALFSQSASTAPENNYVEARLCARCHPQIDADYRRTGMGSSLFRPTAGNTIEDYSNQHQFSHPRSGTQYAMIHRIDGFYQRRWQTGFGGIESGVEEMKIDYVLGSGNHARSYLHRTPRGTLIELPLGW